MSATIKVHGDKELIRLLNELPKKPYRKAVRASLRKGGSVMNKAIKKAVTSEIMVIGVVDGKSQMVDISGDLRQSIGQRAKSYAKDNNFVQVIGPRFNHGGKRTGLRPSKYAGSIEFGTKDTIARPFMRPAFESAKNATLREISNALRVNIAREAAKLRAAR